MTWISQVSGKRRGRFRARYVLAAVVVSLVAAGPAWATFPGLSGPIAFNRFEEDPSPQFRLDLFSVDPTGGGLRQLTDFGWNTFSAFPDYAPDGRTIAFQREDQAVEGPPQIWLADADGSHQRQLTADPCGVVDPAFAPDGRTLAVDSCPGDIQGIFLIPAKSRTGAPLTAADMRRVTRRTDGGFDSEPQVSPDGRWIVFTRYSVECLADDRNGCQTRIFKVRTDGTALTQLTGPELNASAPDWHPTGLWIAFDTNDNGLATNAGNIMVMHADGSGKHVIVRGDGDHFYNNPSFSPDGLRVAFVHWPQPDFDTSEVWTAWVIGGGLKRVTSGGRDNKPDWGSRPRFGHGH